MNTLHQSLENAAKSLQRTHRGPTEDRELLADSAATGRITSATRNAIAKALADADRNGPLEHARLVNVQELLEDSITQTMTTAKRLSRQWAPTNTASLLRSLELALTRAGTRLLLSLAATWTPQEPAMPDRDRAVSAAEAAHLLLQPVMALQDPGAWRHQIRALDLVDTELKHYAATGEPPPWFDPAEMTPTAADRARGHSVVHPRPFDPTDRASVAAYARRRMELFLAPTHQPEAGRSLQHQMSDFLFADMLIAPHVNWQMAGHEGPGRRLLPTHQRIPPAMRLTTGPEPADHAALSYRVALQPRLSTNDLHTQTRTRDADALAKRMTAVALIMPRLEQTLGELTRRMPAEGPGARHTIPEYDPPIRWDDDPETIQAAFSQISSDLTKPQQLATHISSAYAALVDIHLKDHIAVRAAATAEEHRMDPATKGEELRHQLDNARKGPFGHQLLPERPPGGRTLNSPEILLLMQGMEALQHCRETALRLHQMRLRNDPIGFTDSEIIEISRETAAELLNQLAHADWCIVAAHLLLARAPARQPALFGEKS